MKDLDQVEEQILVVPQGRTQRPPAFDTKALGEQRLGVNGDPGLIVYAHRWKSPLEVAVGQERRNEAGEVVVELFEAALGPPSGRTSTGRPVGTRRMVLAQ